MKVVVLLIDLVSPLNVIRTNRNSVRLSAVSDRPILQAGVDKLRLDGHGRCEKRGIEFYKNKVRSDSIDDAAECLNPKVAGFPMDSADDDESSGIIISGKSRTDNEKKKPNDHNDVRYVIGLQALGEAFMFKSFEITESESSLSHLTDSQVLDTRGMSRFTVMERTTVLQN